MRRAVETRAGRDRARCAFTMIELLAVLAIAALLVSVAVASLAGTSRIAVAEDVIAQIAEFDRVARAHARSSGRSLRIVFDPQRQTLRVESPSGHSASATSAPPPPLRLPGAVRLEEVRQGAGAVKREAVEGTISSAGRSRSYALTLVEPEGRRRWLFVAGLTGHVLQYDDEQQVQDIFEAITPGADAR